MHFFELRLTSLYVINAIAISRIEYKMNLTIFNKKEADEVTTKLRKLLRYKIGITNTLLNILLSNKEIFNLFSPFWFLFPYS